MSGLPPTTRRFFRGTPLEPPRAVMRPKTRLPAITLDLRSSIAELAGKLPPRPIEVVGTADVEPVLADLEQAGVLAARDQRIDERRHVVELVARNQFERVRIERI